MLKPDKQGKVSLTVSPFLKVVLVVIALALSLIALRGFLGPSNLYAGYGDEVEVNLKSLGGWTVSGELPVQIKSFSPSSLPVEIKGD